MRVGKFQEAESAFHNALRIDENFVTAHYQLGLLYIDIGEYKRAFEALKKVSRLDRYNIDAHLKTAEFYFIQNKYTESREYLNKIFEHQPSHAEALAVLANIELKKGNDHRAELAIEMAIALKPQKDSFFVLRAKILYNKKIYRLAESDLLKALELNPKNMEAYRLLATYYMDQNNHEKAWEYLFKAVDIFPNMPEPLLELAAYHFAREEKREGELAIRKAISSNIYDVHTYFQAAEIYSQSYMDEEAESILREALSVSEQPLTVMERLAEVCFNRKKYEVAKDIIDTILKQDNQLPLANLIKAKFFIKQGKTDQAITTLNFLIQAYPDWGEAYFQLSLAELKGGNLEKSQAAANQAMRFLKQDSRAHTLLAHHHLHKRDFFHTEMEANTALNLNPQNIQAAMILGQSYLFTHRIDRALELFEEINVLLPENTDILYNLSLAKIARLEIDEGLVLLEYVLKLDSSFTPALAKITEIYSRKKRFDKAIERIQRHVSDNITQPEHLLLLGDLYFSIGDLVNARRVFLQLQQMDPGEPRSYIKLATIQQNNQNIKLALSEYSKLLKINPKSLPALMGYAILLEKSGNRAEAKIEYQKVLSLDGNFAPAANNLSWLIMQDKDANLTEALRLAKLAKKAQPNSPAISDTLGYAYYLKGLYGLATIQFREAVSLLPQEPTLRYHLALSLKAQKADKEALAELHKCINMSQEFPEKQKAESFYQKWTKG